MKNTRIFHLYFLISFILNIFHIFIKRKKKEYEIIICLVCFQWLFAIIIMIIVLVLNQQ